MTLPPVAPAVTADAVAALPGRLRARLDAAVEQAPDWPADRDGDVVTVRPDAQVTVTLKLPVCQPGDAVCSCLLAPRCLHRAAVLSAAPILPDPGPPSAAPPAKNAATTVDGLPESGPAPAPQGSTASESHNLAARATHDGAAPATAAAAPPLDAVRATHEGPAPTRGAGTVPVFGAKSAAAEDNVPAEAHEPDESDSHRDDRAASVSDLRVEVARQLWDAAAVLLGTGVPGAGAVAQAELLRAAHQARGAGLHAAATAAVRVVEQVRALRREEPGARLADLTDDLRELLTAGHRLGRRDAGAIGVARRDYAPVGDLRLYGLCCEPVRAATGHAGAVTYLADEAGRLWVVSDVKPAAPGDVRALVRASVQLGEVRLSHHELARAGVRAVNAHASVAGRLSHGRARQAVAAAGAGWFEQPLDGLWRTDPADQAERWLAASAQPAHERAAAYDLAFLDGVIAGAGPAGLLLASDRSGGTVTVGAPVEDPALPYVTNLRLLAAHARGHRVRLVARFAGPRRVAALAVAAPWLPGRHIDLGAQSLGRADLPGPATDDTGPPARPEPAVPPLHLLRHLLERVVAAGRPALLSGVADDARSLAAAQLATAAAVAAALGAAGTRRTRDVFGRLDPHDPHRLAVAWLTAATYEHAAAAEVIRRSWRGTDR